MVALGASFFFEHCQGLWDSEPSFALIPHLDGRFLRGKFGWNNNEDIIIGRHGNCNIYIYIYILFKNIFCWSYQVCVCVQLCKLCQAFIICWFACFLCLLGPSVLLPPLWGLLSSLWTSVSSVKWRKSSVNWLRNSSGQHVISCLPRCRQISWPWKAVRPRRRLRRPNLCWMPNIWKTVNGLLDIMICQAQNVLMHQSGSEVAAKLSSVQGLMGSDFDNQILRTGQEWCQKTMDEKFKLQLVDAALSGALTDFSKFCSGKAANGRVLLICVWLATSYCFRLMHVFFGHAILLSGFSQCSKFWTYTCV